MKPAQFEFADLSGGYGDVNILNRISGQVSSGEVLGIFGRNGVGKTTLARMLAGSIPATTGAIVMNGVTVTHHEAFARRRMGLGYMSQTSMVFDNLSVRENLSLAKNDIGIMELFAMFPILANRQNQLAGSMSGGERKILAFARIMLEETQVIILDEPSEGVQPENIAHMEKCITDRCERGHGVILIEQNLNMLMNLSDRYIGLDSGNPVYSGSSEEATREHLLEVLLV